MRKEQKAARELGQAAIRLDKARERMARAERKYIAVSVGPTTL